MKYSLGGVLLGLLLLLPQPSIAKDICVSFFTNAPGEYRHFLEILERYDDYFPAGTRLIDELEIERSDKAALSRCFTGKFQSVALIFHSRRVGDLALLAAPSDAPNNVTYVFPIDLMKLPMRGINDIVLISCHGPETFKTYNQFKFWTDLGVKVSKVETPSLFSAEGNSYASIYQAANKVAELFWNFKYKSPAPFQNLEILSDQ